MDIRNVSLCLRPRSDMEAFRAEPFHWAATIYDRDDRGKTLAAMPFWNNECVIPVPVDVSSRDRIFKYLPHMFSFSRSIFIIVLKNICQVIYDRRVFGV